MLIRSRSAIEGQPFANMLPIVEALVQSGSKTLDGGFLLNPDGWRCRVDRLIDFDLVKDAFELPSSIILSEEHDSILDRLSWCVIEGPCAHVSTDVN